MHNPTATTKYTLPCAFTFPRSKTENTWAYFAHVLMPWPTQKKHIHNPTDATIAVENAIQDRGRPKISL